MIGPFNGVDLLLLAIAAPLAWIGWRHGLVSGVLSFLGFVLGAVLGIVLAPHVLAWLGLSGLGALAVTLGMTLLLAGAGNAVLVTLGRLVRNRIVWRPIRMIDSVGGAMFAVLSLAAVSWLVASAIVVLPDGGLAQQVHNSSVLGAIDDTVPEQARTWVSDLGQMLDDSGFPRVFSGLGAEPIVPVPAADPALLADPAVRRSLNSLVRVEGIAPDCGTRIDGSGFVFAAHRVMTNAHVVAGTARLGVSLRGTGPLLQASVVYLDPELDVAVLDVPGLSAPALDFAAPARSGMSGVVAGFPGGGSLTVVAARVRAQLIAQGKDIYGTGDVLRQVYSLRAQVHPGNSGGPLLSADGEVLGVVFAAAIDDPDTGYALTASQVQAAVVAGSTATLALGTGSCHTG